MAAQQAQDAFDTLIGYVFQGYQNFVHNVAAFINMSGLQWIRIITIVGAYLLLRPYLTKAAAAGAAKKQAEALNDEEVVQRRRDRELEGMNIITPNILRGENNKKVELPESSDSEEGEGEGEGKGTGVKWGGKARKRQRALVRKIIEQEERARREARDVGGFVSDEDKDIEEYLT